MSQATTTTTTVVTELPDEQRWQGRDWVKALIAGGLALALLRPGAQPAATTLPAPTVALPAATLPAVAPAPTAAPTAAATTAPAAAILPIAEIPLIISTREAIFAGPYTVRGSGTPGSTVEVLVNGTSVGTATVGDDGRWSLETALEAGENELLARAVDESGATVAEGDPVRLGVQAAPVAIAAPTFDAPAGELPGGPAVLTGTGVPGSTVRVTIGGVDAGTATVADDGTWELEAILVAGTPAVVVETLDAGGQAVAASEPTSITVVGGTGVTITVPSEGATLPAGPITVSGTGAAGTVLEILNGDLVLATTRVGEDGSWSAEVPVADGSASISVREQGSDQILSRPVRVQVGAVAGSACMAVAVGCEAWVTRGGGLQLRMRSSGAILANNIIARLPIGTQMTVLEGPSPADSFTWWRVRTIGGQEGWVAGENLVPQPD